jgi:beta-fructofuranosidase
MFFHGRGYRALEVGWRRGFRLTGHFISIDTSCSSILPDARSRAPETGHLYMNPKESLKLHVFIDRSVVEVFVNDRQCVAVRVYPGREDSLGVSLIARGRDAKLKSLDAWRMKSIYAQSE